MSGSKLQMNSGGSFPGIIAQSVRFTSTGMEPSMGGCVGEISLHTLTHHRLLFLLLHLRTTTCVCKSNQPRLDHVRERFPSIIKINVIYETLSIPRRRGGGEGGGRDVCLALNCNAKHLSIKRTLNDVPKPVSPCVVVVDLFSA